MTQERGISPTPANIIKLGLYFQRSNLFLSLPSGSMRQPHAGERLQPQELGVELSHKLNLQTIRNEVNQSLRSSHQIGQQQGTPQSIRLEMAAMTAPFTAITFITAAHGLEGTELTTKLEAALKSTQHPPVEGNSFIEELFRTTIPMGESAKKILNNAEIKDAIVATSTDFAYTLEEFTNRVHPRAKTDPIEDAYQEYLKNFKEAVVATLEVLAKTRERKITPEVFFAEKTNIKLPPRRDLLTPTTGERALGEEFYQNLEIEAQEFFDQLFDKTTATYVQKRASAPNGEITADTLFLQLLSHDSIKSYLHQTSPDLFDGDEYTDRVKTALNNFISLNSVYSLTDGSQKPVPFSDELQPLFATLKKTYGEQPLDLHHIFDAMVDILRIKNDEGDYEFTISGNTVLSELVEELRANGLSSPTTVRMLI